VAAAAMLAPPMLSHRVAAARGCLLPPGALPFPGRPAGQPQPDLAPELANIDHIFLIMMENKSFDAYFGMLPHSPATRSRLAGRVDGFRALDSGGRPTDTLADKDGRWYQSFANQRSCATSKPDVSWDYSHHAYNGGAMDGFVSYHSGAAAMGYWDERILSTYYSLAAHFPVGDRYFSSTLASTDPNRLFSICGSAVGVTDTQRPSPQNPGNLTQVSPPNGHIFEMLDHYGIGWATFCGNAPTVGLIAGGYAETHAENIHIGGSNEGAIAVLRAHIAAGALPPVITIEPDFVLGSEENANDIDAGQHFVHDAVTAIMADHALWMRSLIIYCYDESGGNYDHAIPPPAPQPGDGSHPRLPPPQWYGDDYTRYGFRVPNLVISPWAKADHVSHVVRDHGSLLRTIEAKWNLPALTARDANAADFRECLVATGPPPFALPPDVAPCPDPSPAEDIACNQGRADTGPSPRAVAAPAQRTQPEVIEVSSACPANAAERATGVDALLQLGLPGTSAESPSLSVLAAVAAGLGAIAAATNRRRAPSVDEDETEDGSSTEARRRHNS
jgi:phospholipase C